MRAFLKGFSTSSKRRVTPLVHSVKSQLMQLWLDRSLDKLLLRCCMLHLSRIRCSRASCIINQPHTIKFRGGKNASSDPLNRNDSSRGKYCAVVLRKSQLSRGCFNLTIMKMIFQQLKVPPKDSWKAATIVFYGEKDSEQDLHLVTSASHTNKEAPIARNNAAEATGSFVRVHRRTFE